MIVLLLFIVPLFLISLAAKGVNGINPSPLIKEDQSIPPLTDNQPLGITIMTYNIGYASGDKNNLGAVLSKEEVLSNLDQIAQVIQNQNPDLIALQEVDIDAARSYHINQAEYLAKKAGYPYTATVITWNKRYVAWPYWPPQNQFGQVVSGQTILSRYPLKEQQVILFDKPKNNPFWYNWFYLDRMVQFLQVELPQGSLSIWATHLEAFDSQTREEQANILSRYIAANNNKPTLLLGDFNSISKKASNLTLKEETEIEDNGQSLAIIENMTGLINAESSITGLTFPSWKPIKKIDHIFYRSDLKLKSVQVIEGILASDHLPLVAEFN